jgi:hypothetical protein
MNTDLESNININEPLCKSSPILVQKRFPTIETQQIKAPSMASIPERNEDDNDPDFETQIAETCEYLKSNVEDLLRDELINANATAETLQQVHVDKAAEVSDSTVTHKRQPLGDITNKLADNPEHPPAVVVNRKLI